MSESDSLQLAKCKNGTILKNICQPVNIFQMIESFLCSILILIQIRIRFLLSIPTGKYQAFFSGSVSFWASQFRSHNYLYGSGSFRQHATKLRNPWFLQFCDFFLITCYLCRLMYYIHCIMYTYLQHIRNKQ